MKRLFRGSPRRLFLLPSFVLAALVFSQTTAAALQLTLNWGDTSTNEDGFKVERKAGATGTFAQLATVGANVVSYADASVTGGAAYCYRVRAYNTAGDSAYSNEACGTVSADTQAPLVSLSAPAGSTTVSGTTVIVSALASDNVRVVSVQFLLDGANLGSEATTAPYSTTWNTTTAANGAHSLTAVARDAAGNRATSTTVAVTVSNSAPPPPNATGLVAAYSFNEGSGSSVADASGSGNTGAISGAIWITTGKFGSALSFNGTSNWVTINDAPSLDLTTAITLEAWVHPAVTLNGWRSLLIKEMAPEAAYELYANTDVNKPGGYVFVGGQYGGAFGAFQLSANTWTHLTTTYDGTTIKLYVNSNLVGAATRAGAIATSSGPLRIGGSSMWGEYFQGQIDEIRVYNRALSASEIQTDMNTPVSTSPPSPLTYTLTLAKAGSGSGTVSSSPTGINCGATCSASYTSGAVVTLTATPASGSTFANWSGDADCADGSVTMTVAKTCTATFTLQTFALTVTKVGTGSGTITGADINCGADCSESYSSGTAVTLTATPASGSTFIGWSGGCSSAGTCMVTMSAAISVTATFALVPPTFTLTITKAGTGNGKVISAPAGIDCGATCSANYAANTAVALTPTPATGSIFTGWSGGGCSGTGACMVTLSAATTVTATFTPRGARIGVFRSSTGEWYLDANGNGILDDCAIGGCPSFGQQGNLPIAGDWLGTSVVQLGVFDPTTLQWQLDRNNNDIWEGCTIDLCFSSFSQKGDLPVVGHWNTKLTNDRIGLYRPSKRYWRFDLNDNGTFNTCPPDGCADFGLLTGLPVAGDWTGEGTTKLGLFSAGRWRLDVNGNGKWDKCIVDKCFSFGLSGDLPVAGDWNGTGQAKIGVFTPSTGLWELDLNGNGVFDGCNVDTCLGPFGQQGDIPVVGKW